MAPLSQPDVLPSAAASQALSLTVAHALQSAGFKSASSHLLLTLTTVVEKYLLLLATTSDNFAESTGRRRAAVIDVLDALEELTGDAEDDLLEWVDGRGLAGNHDRKEAKVVYEGLHHLKGMSHCDPLSKSSRCCADHVNDGVPRKSRRSLLRYQAVPDDMSPTDDVDASPDSDAEVPNLPTEAPTADDSPIPPWLPPLPRLGHVDVEVVEEEEEGGGYADAALPEAISGGDRSHPYRIAPAPFEGDGGVFAKLSSRRKPAAPPVASSTLPYFMEAYQKAKEQQPGPALAYRRFKETAARVISESIGDPLHLPSPRWPAPAGNPIAPSYPMHKSGAVFNGSYAQHAPELPRHLLGSTADGPLIDVVASEMSGLPGITNDRSPWINGDMFERFTRVKPPPPLHSANGPIVYGDPSYPTMAPGQSAGSVARSETGKLILRVEDPITLEPTWDIGNWGDWGQWIDPDESKVLAKDAGQRLDPELVQQPPMEVDELDFLSGAVPTPRIKLNFGGAAAPSTNAQESDPATNGAPQEARDVVQPLAVPLATPSESTEPVTQDAQIVPATEPTATVSLDPQPPAPTTAPRFKLKLVRKQSTAPEASSQPPAPSPSQEARMSNEAPSREEAFVKDEPMS